MRGGGKGAEKEKAKNWFLWLSREEYTALPHSKSCLEGGRKEGSGKMLIANILQKLHASIIMLVIYVLYIWYDCRYEGGCWFDAGSEETRGGAEGGEGKWSDCGVRGWRGR
jgi:hypothetical protein